MTGKANYNSDATNKNDMSLPTGNIIARLRARPLWAVFGAALLLRLLLLVLIDGQGAMFAHGFMSDAGKEFTCMACGLLRQGDFTLQGIYAYNVPSAYQPPLYPLLLAVVFALRGLPLQSVVSDHAALIFVQLLNCVVGALWCACLYRIGRQLFGPRVGIVAGLIGAVYPALVYSVVEVHPLNLFLLLLLLFLSTACRCTSGEPVTKRTVALLGVTAGLLTLTRSESVLLCPLILAGLALRRRNVLREMGAALLICLLFLLPWIVRNHHSFGHWTLTNTSGVNLFRGQGPTANGGTYTDDGHLIWFTPEILAQLAAQPVSRDWEVRQDALLRRAALDYIRQNPARPLMLAPHKLFYFLVRDRTHPKGRSPLVWVPGLLLLVCALRGAWIVRPRWSAWWPLALVPVFYTGIVVVLFSLPRYRMMIDPVLMLFAACALIRPDVGTPQNDADEYSTR